MGKKIFLFLACMCMTASMAFAQTQQVTGSVIDSETGEPLIGASVKVEGTTLAALTDSDGKFVLNNLPRSAKQVTVSYMGMNTVKAYIKPHMAITLSPNAQDMSEVMVGAQASTENMSRMANELRDEANDMYQIDESVSKVSEIVDNNSAASQETAAVSQEQTAQVALMVQMIQKFEL